MNGNRKGGIEGLPLQLMIIILVATLGSAILIGWMSSIDSPHYIKTLGIEQNVVEVENCVIGDIDICVLDGNNEPLKGVTVMIENTSVKMPKEFVTDSEGKVTLTGCTVPYGYSVTKFTLKITGYLSGYTECTQTLVAVMK